MDIHFFAKSDVGRVRSGNEDYFINEKIEQGEYLFIVADGMGGHQAGDVASRLASHTFLENYRLLRRKLLPIGEAMEAAVRKSNAVILKKAQDDPTKHGMGTTFSALVVRDMIGHIVHIGDSRIYLIRDGQIRRITTDHSFVEKLVEDGRISREEAREHPQKNVLYMSLGAREGFEPEVIGDFSVQDGDIFLMCSDGLSNMVPDELLREYAQAYYPEEAAEALVRLANVNGGSDNITIQIIRFGHLEELEDTRPMKALGAGKKFVTFFTAFGVLVVLGVIWLFLRHGFDANEPRPAAPTAAAPSLQAPPFRAVLRAVNADGLEKMGLLPESFRFYIDGRLFIQYQNSWRVLTVKNGVWEELRAEVNAVPVPADLADYYFLLSKGGTRPEYRLMRNGGAQPVLTVRIHGAMLAADARARTVTIPAGGDRLMPVFMNHEVLLLRDHLQYYVIHGWNTSTWRVFPLTEIGHSESTKLTFFHQGETVRMIHFRPEGKIIRVFNLPDFVRHSQWQDLAMDIPLALEWAEDGGFIFYFPDRCIKYHENEKTLESRYRFEESDVRAAAVLPDQHGGGRLLVGENGRLFTLDWQ